MLDHVLQIKGEAKKVNIENVTYNFYILAHNGSGVDSYVVLNNLPQWRTVFGTIQNGSGIVSLKKMNGYVDQNNKNPHYVQFRCINNSLKKIGISYKLQPSLLNHKLNHDEIYEDFWEENEKVWLPFLKNDVLSTAFSYGRYTKRMEN